jgi:hypothetical protein
MFKKNNAFMDTLITRLREFQLRDKFTKAELTKFELSSFDSTKRDKIDQVISECVERLVEEVSKKRSKKKKKLILRRYFKKFQRKDYTPEERDLVYENYLELAKIVKVDMKNQLDRWILGLELYIAFKTMMAYAKRNIKETITYNCKNCEEEFYIHITKRSSDIPDVTYDIVQCSECREYNLIDKGAGIESFRFGKCDWVEQLEKSRFSEEQAIARFEQVKLFRK